MFILTIDAGGSHTRFELFDIDGKSIKSLTSKSCHINQVDKHRTSMILSKGVHILTKNLDQTNYIISAGLAGYGSSLNKQKWEDIFHKTFPNTNFTLTSDAHIALIGAHKGKNGLLLICGTGSIGLKYYQQKISRIGGWGFHFGDEGSGYWIGKKALQTFSKQADNRIQKTELFAKVMQYYQLNQPQDILNTPTLSLTREHIASLAPLILTLAEDGEMHAKSIIDLATYELSRLINQLSIENEPLPLVLHGGLWKNQYFTKLFALKINPSQTYLVSAKNSALYGGYLLGKEKIKS